MEKVKNKFEIPEEVKDISHRLTVAGFENFLGGGGVRDLLMRREPKNGDTPTKKFSNPATVSLCEISFTSSGISNLFFTFSILVYTELVEVCSRQDSNPQ